MRRRHALVTIPDAMRDELDQTPAWWSRQYRNLLARTFRPVSFDPSTHEGHDVIEDHLLNGTVITMCAQCPQEYEPIPKGEGRE